MQTQFFSSNVDANLIRNHARNSLAEQSIKDTYNVIKHLPIQAGRRGRPRIRINHILRGNHKAFVDDVCHESIACLDLARYDELGQHSLNFPLDCPSERASSVSRVVP